MADLTATCAAQALDGGSAPELVHLLPLGAILGRDGRRFVLDDAAGFITRTKARGGDLPVDYEHQSEDLMRQKNGPVPAAGWIKELVLRRDGIWGRVEWTETARNMIAAREYRYLSPAFTHDRGRLLRLKGAGLVHTPNLELTALARQETDTMDEDTAAAELEKAVADLSRIAAALGLAEDADAEAILAALAERTSPSRAAPDPSRYVPIEAVSELMRERSEQAATMSQTDAERRVEDAMEAGHLTPAMFDWGVALCRQDAASFDAFLEGSAAPYARLFDKPRFARLAPVKDTGAATDDDTAALCRQLGLRPDQLK